MYQVIFVSCDQYLSFTHSAFPHKRKPPFLYLSSIFSGANPDNVSYSPAGHSTIGFSPPKLLLGDISLD